MLTHARADVSPSLRRLHGALAPAHARLAARDDAILRTQVALSQIPAPTGAEGARARRVARLFGALGGLDVHTDDAGNVVAVRRGSDAIAPVVVCAHLDTVFPSDTTLAFTRAGERVVGPGIGDNGRGLAAMLALAEEIDGQRVRTRRPIMFVATTGEEGAGDLRGAKHLFSHLEVVPDSAIVLDGAGDERVVHRALGSRRFRISYRGPGGHSWAAFGVPNAVHAAGGAASRLASLVLPVDPRTTLSVCRIGGGLSINAIPADAWLEIDLRSTSTSLVDRYEHEVRRIAHIAAEEENGRRASGTPPLSCLVEVIGERPCGDVPRDHPLVRTAVETTRLIDRDPELAAASTDANVPISRGIPAVALGAGGRGGDAHTCAEWFDNTNATLGLIRALTIIVAAAA